MGTIIFSGISWSALDSVTWLSILLDASLKGAVLLVGAGIVVVMLRRASAPTRHLVWFLALASVVVLPVLSLALPAWRLPILPPSFSASETAPVDVAPISPPPDPAPAVTTLPPVEFAETPPPELPPSPPLSFEAAPVVVPTTEAASTSRHWSTWVLLAWAAGAGSVLAYLLIGTVGVWRIARRARPVGKGSPWAGVADALTETCVKTLRRGRLSHTFGHFQRENHVAQPPRLRSYLGRTGFETGSSNLRLKKREKILESEGVAVPMMWGIFRPVVLLPAGAEDWPEERRRIVLLHELAHLKRRDCLTQTLAQLACAFYWFNPLVWVAARRLRIERERACDDHVLNAGLTATGYAAHLLEIARSARGLRCAAVAAVAMARPSQLEGRLLAILDSKRSRRTITRLTLAIALLAVASVVLPLGIIRPVAKAAEQPEKVNAEGRELGETARPTAVTVVGNRELIERIRKAEEKLSSILPQGRGTARVTVIHEFQPKDDEERKKKEQDFIAEFKFKGKRRRTEYYSATDGRKGELTRAHINTGEIRYGYIAGVNAYVAEGGTADTQRYRVLGYDFHPDTFSVPNQIPLAKQLGFILDEAKKFEARLRPDGLLEITVFGNTLQPTWERSGTIVLDPQKNYAIIDYVWESQIDEDGSTISVHYHAEYDEEFCKSYPKHVVFHEEGYAGSARKRAAKYPVTTETIDVQIQSLDTESKVNDEDFAFESLKLPAGTSVSDEIFHVVYPYDFDETPQPRGHPPEPVAKTTEQMNVFLPDVDHRAVMLNLASEELVAIPEADKNANEHEILLSIDRLGKGDLVYDAHALILVRGSAAKGSTRDDMLPLERFSVQGPLPTQTQVTTREGRRFLVTVTKADKEGCQLAYYEIPSTPQAGASLSKATIELGDKRISAERVTLNKDGSVTLEGDVRITGEDGSVIGADKAEITREGTLRSAAMCSSNLAQIAKAIIAYQQNNRDNLPPSLADLFPNFLNDPKVLICPADEAPMKIKRGLLCSYRYIGNVPWRDLKTGFFVAYDHAAHDGGRNVLYFDGHVSHLAEENFKKSLARLYEEFKPLMAEPGFPGDRERVKAFCEDKDFAEQPTGSIPELAENQEEHPAAPVSFGPVIERASFKTLTFSMRSTWAYNRTLTIQSGGDYAFDMEPPPREGKGYHAAYRLKPEHLAELDKRVRATNWLTAPGAREERNMRDGTKYLLTADRDEGKASVVCYGDQPPVYEDLIRFLRRIDRQEWLLYQITTSPDRRQHAISDINGEVRAVQGAPGTGRPYAPVLDYQRFVPTFVKTLSGDEEKPRDELIAAVRVMDIAQVKSMRGRIAELALDDDFDHESALQALVRFDGEKAIPVLRELLVRGGSLRSAAAWDLIQLGAPALSVIVEGIESGKPRDDVHHEALIRAYIDHWPDVAKPIDGRVVEAVRNSMWNMQLGNGRIVYHREFLQLVGATEPRLLNARETAEETLKALVAGEETPLIRWNGRDETDAGHRAATEKALGDLSALRIARVVADKYDALAVTDVVQGPDGPRGRLVLYLGRDGVVWKLGAMIVEPLDRKGDYLERFLAKHPEAKELPAGRRADDVSFGPVIERTLVEKDDVTFLFLDLDKNRTLDPPEVLLTAQGEKLSRVTDFSERTSERVLRWARRNGIDALVHVDKTTFGMRGVGLRRNGGGPDPWSLPAEQIAAVLAPMMRIQPGSFTFQFVIEKPHPGYAFPFLTREGGMGVLQIVGFTENPSGVKIRYKMVQGEPKEQADANGLVGLIGSTPPATVVEARQVLAKEEHLLMNLRQLASAGRASVSDVQQQELKVQIAQVRLVELDKGVDSEAAAEARLFLAKAQVQKEQNLLTNLRQLASAGRASVSDVQQQELKVLEAQIRLAELSRAGEAENLHRGIGK